MENRGATFCEIATPIYWSKKDTEETVKQVKKHNAHGVELNCPNWPQALSPKIPN